MKNIAHGRSTLGLSGDYLIPVDYHDRFFPFYWNKISGRGDEPILDVATIVPDKRFGKVVAVEEETTNLMKNPSFKDGMTSWSSYYGAVVDIKNDYVEIKTTKQTSGIYQAVSVTSGKTYTLSYWYKWVDGINTVGGHIDGSIYSAKIRIDKGQWITSTVIEVPKDGKWHLIEETFTPTSDLSSCKIYIQPGRGSSNTSIGRVRTDRGFGVQLEERGWATSFTAGSRSRGSLTYQQSLFNPHEFTISTWFKINNNQTKYQPIVEICASAHQYNRLLIMNYATSTGIIVWYGNAEVNTHFSTGFKPELDKWYMLTLTYDGTAYVFYVDGKEKARRNGPMVTPLPNATVNIGGRHWGVLNGQLANFLISPRAAHPDEIEAWHEYGKAFYDPYNYYAVWG